MKGRPNSRRNLDLAIERLADSREEGLRLRRVFANTVVAQMMPQGAVKGGHNEIGDADSPDYFMSEEIAELFGALGFPPPDPIPLMQLKYQIAQKLHGASEPESSRAHDLVDLQIIMAEGDIDLRSTREVCHRLFAYRRMQAWPPTVRTNDKWAELYNAAKEDLPVLPAVDEAVDWANRLISQIEHCEND